MLDQQTQSRLKHVPHGNPTTAYTNEAFNTVTMVKTSTFWSLFMLRGLPASDRSFRLNYI